MHTVVTGKGGFHLAAGLFLAAGVLMAAGTSLGQYSNGRFAPEADCALTFTMQALRGDKTQLTDWRRYEGVRWFGETAQRNIKVNCPGVVDNTTLTGKAMFGYQGWFLTPRDGSPVNEWIHWFKDNTPDEAHATFDFWPDLAEYEADELYDSNMVYAGGTKAALYSAYREKTVLRHMKWLKDYDLDGVYLQRFSAGLAQDLRFLDARDTNTRHVMKGCEQYGRVFVIEYDTTGHAPDNRLAELQQDWKHLVDDLKVTSSPAYLRHKGRPLLAIWGFGFNDRKGDPPEAAAIIDWFKNQAAPQYRVTLLGGTPTRWRTLDGDSKPDAGWADVYRSYDVIMPWLVGRYSTERAVDNFVAEVLKPDLAEAAKLGIDYVAVPFPGFSWHHMFPSDPINQIPRQGGRFFWKQVYAFQQAGVQNLKFAMFDEVDEGTAMFKLAETKAQTPADTDFLTLDRDGEALPSDWYLRLAGQATKMLRGEIPLTATIPLKYQASADYDGDGKADPGVYDETTGNWRVRLSTANYLLVEVPALLGGPGWLPIGADFDGDGLADPAVCQTSSGTWRAMLTSANYLLVEATNLVGGPGWLPVANDYEGDHLADPAAYEQATGTWQFRLSGSNYSALTITNWLGDPGFMPALGDYDGDSKADPGVYQEATGNWQMRLSTAAYSGVIQMNAFVGGPGYHAAPADYDGDGTTDAGVFQPSSGNWKILLSSATGLLVEVNDFLH